MIQQDLAKLGMKINIVTLDFPSLIERMTRTLNYEACLLGLVNVDPDPSELMNVLLSSASNHPWNPSQKTPETAVGGGDRPADAGAGGDRGLSGCAKRTSTGCRRFLHEQAARHLSAASERAVGGLEAGHGRQADGVFSAHVLGHAEHTLTLFRAGR